jgi:predicted acyl esterase
MGWILATGLLLLGCLNSPLWAADPTQPLPTVIDRQEVADGRTAVRDWASRFASAIREKHPGEKLTIPITSTESVQMRDGVQLSTDLYLPFGSLIGNEYPAVLMRTPYDKGDLSSLGYALVLEGFAAVIQDVRGRFESSGEMRTFFDDGWGLDPTGTHWDGYDTVEWCARQDWCDGKVGMFGFSSLGISANLTAGAKPPHLLCAVIYVAASDLYHDGVHQGGGFRKELAEEWLADVGALPDVLQVIRAHESYDAFWQNASVAARHSQISIPIYHVGGWYDIFLQGTLNNFAGLQANGAGLARGNQKLVVGPWTHSGEATTTQGELTYPPNSVIETQEIQNGLDWFKFWLMGEGGSILNLPPVRYYLMGAAGESGAPGNDWRSTSTWPVQSIPTPLFLYQGGFLYGRSPASATSTSAFSYDPGNPVPTLGGANLNIDAGPYDQRSTESRPDVLTFTSPVLTGPLEIVGPLEVVLYASSNAPDTDWTAKVCDVYPDGRSMLVTDGILRGRYRGGFETPQLLPPGAIGEFHLDLWSTALVFNAGHRIRVDISSSNSPRFEPNPNTGEVSGLAAPKAAAANMVYHSKIHCSRLVLPVTSPPAHPLFQTGDRMEVSVLQLR